MKLTQQELIMLQNLLFIGKFGLNLQEADQTVRPLINKLAEMAREFDKKEEEKK